MSEKSEMSEVSGVSGKPPAFVYGPTFEEMLHPEQIPPTIRTAALRARTEAPLDPVNLFDITWKDASNRVAHVVLPRELTGVDAPIVVLIGRRFPTGSHKVGATYSCCIERQVRDEIVPGRDRLVWPSTGNYGIGGAYVGPRLHYQSLVLLPEGMSRERFEIIRGYGANYIATPGCESNVKEIYDLANTLAREPHTVVINQFAEFGNYRFHAHVTGKSIIALFDELRSAGQVGRLAGFVSAMGSGGTIAAGDTLRVHDPGVRVVGLEPVQCPTLFCNGYGAHDIQGIGDKHVTWIHNTDMLDAVMCIDEWDCKLGLQLFTEPAGQAALRRHGIEPELVAVLAQDFGISSVCNLLGAIKTAKHYRLGPRDAVFTIATDGRDRYPSVLEQVAAQRGALDEAHAAKRLETIFHMADTEWIREGTPHARDCWANLKYFTWVEQQGKPVEELRRQRDPEYWLEQLALVPETDRLIRERRGY
jgi:cysteine synthase